MSASYAQHWGLRRMDRWIARPGPHLAVMLGIFARLAAGDYIAKPFLARELVARVDGQAARRLP